MTKGKIALGAVVGALAGLIAGLLTAPKSGKETRADLKKKVNELREDVARSKEEIKPGKRQKVEGVLGDEKSERKNQE